LASKLQARTAGLGSPLYALTWKPWDMPSGPPICALRASARRTSGSDSGGEASGWPTPSASGFEAKDLERLEQRRAECAEKHGNNGFGLTLGQAAPLLAGWATPTASLATKGARPEPGEIMEAMRSHGPDLAALASLAGWATPAARDFKSANAKTYAERGGGAKGEQLSNQAKHLPDYDGPARLTSTGEMLIGSAAGMDGGGQLSPGLARWLQAYPIEWDDCAVTVTPLSRKSARRS
jgi:hypothetical protein